MILDKDVNSGLVKKCKDSRWKGYSTDFEGIIVKSMSMASGISKKKMLQTALQTLSSSKVLIGEGDTFVHPLLLSYCKEQSSKGKTGKAEDGGDGSETPRAEASSAAIVAQQPVVGGSASAASAATRPGVPISRLAGAARALQASSAKSQTSDKSGAQKKGK